MLLALTMALVAWRVGAGAVVIKANNESTMILGLPIWIAYALMAPAFALTSLIGLHGATADWKKGHA
jgi:TRAP-type C4-dicarboxylate transport system permease small subunit